MMDALDYIINTPVAKRDLIMPLLVCADGFSLSVQASMHHYCTPRNNEGPWTEVEVGFPSVLEEILLPYAEDEEDPIETVYGYVPVSVVRGVIRKHGGC